ncbi:hypothetical protein HA402_008346 [Bradysia odoriphaga]|nr:hypothetical protein HA402_008346 [Bradysia odoriphaga]
MDSSVGAGKYVPPVTHKIHSENEHLSSSSENLINLKGLIMGNAFIDPFTTINFGTFFYDLGMMDYRQLQYFQQEEDKARRFIEVGKYVDAFDEMDKLFLESNYTSMSSYFTQATGYNTVYNILRTDDPEELLFIYIVVNCLMFITKYRMGTYIK